MLEDIRNILWFCVLVLVAFFSCYPLSKGAWARLFRWADKKLDQWDEPQASDKKASSPAKRLGLIVMAILLVGCIGALLILPKPSSYPDNKVCSEKMTAMLDGEQPFKLSDVFSFDFDKAYVVHIEQVFADKDYFVDTLGMKTSIDFHEFHHEFGNHILFFKDDTVIYDFWYEFMAIYPTETDVWIFPDTMVTLTERQRDPQYNGYELVFTGEINAGYEIKPVEYTMADFSSIIVGVSTPDDVGAIATTDSMLITSYGGQCKFPAKGGGYIVIKFNGPELVVSAIEQTKS